MSALGSLKLLTARMGIDRITVWGIVSWMLSTWEGWLRGQADKVQRIQEMRAAETRLEHLKLIYLAVPAVEQERDTWRRKQSSGGCERPASSSRCGVKESAVC